MWIDGETEVELTNVIVRLADSTHVHDEKILSLQRGRIISPVELAIPFNYDGQLTVRLSCQRMLAASANETNATGDDVHCQNEEFPVHPLEAIQSLSLRLERAVYHPDDVGKLFGLRPPTGPNKQPHENAPTLKNKSPFVYLVEMFFYPFFLTVTIWLACLDQHGQIMVGSDPDQGPSKGIQAVQVAVHDPNNVIVQYWSVSLVGSGLKNLLFHLSGPPQQMGTWTIRATAGGITATQSFRLMTAASRDTPPASLTRSNRKDNQDLLMVVESHFVELDFSPRTANIIQLGCPFAGEVMRM